ncbi:MAG TPA: 2-oxoacid:acceptor oxidoreductase subunit alpha [Candidatus Acidoferrales bacterium]|nr:2-oxoacid:acceptor oxidoreductase subunit alpha [Candidatus Acidoferrales bacterium]
MYVVTGPNEQLESVRGSSFTPRKTNSREKAEGERKECKLPEENNLTWVIGGPQGGGINSVAETFAKACARGGLHVFANIEYHSNIKGEHSFYRVRASERDVRSHVDWIDLLIALDKETLFGDVHKAFPTHNGHRNEVSPGGGIIYDAALRLKPEDIGRPDANLYPVPYLDVLIGALKESGHEHELSKYQVMTNTVAFGASVALIDYDFNVVASAIKEGFTGRKAALGDLNVTAAKRGYEYVRKTFPDGFAYKLHTVPSKEKRIVMRGVQAVGIAKFRAGCAFQTYYPITPATDESEYLESHQKDYNMVVVQTEDEISAILMATGAAHAGVRAATSTSGPGFSLMAEGLGWAGHTEAPGPVVILYQRAGPSTGLPTRTEQGDLQFVLHAGHGEFPRMAIAPGDAIECFYDTFDAFNHAEKFQMPVVVIADKFLASSYKTVTIPESQDLKIDRGQIVPETELQGRNELFKRYAFTPLGISPRTIPGTKGGIFHTTGDEHDEFGGITENSENRIKMMQKRMHKLQLATELIPNEKKVNFFGPKEADVTLVGWGSTKGAILDAMQDLEADAVRCNFLQVRYMSPFPTELVTKYLSNAKRKILVEGNYSGQLGSIIREHTGIAMDSKVLKYNGRVFSQNEVYDGVKQVMNNGTKEVVMAHA